MYTFRLHIPACYLKTDMILKKNVLV